MSTIEQTVEVDVPVRTAYDQWTQFETFPEFMQGVKSVRQIDDTHLHWDAEIAGVEREWDAEIVAQEPDVRIAWRSTTGARNDGAVTFLPLDDRHSRVRLELDFEPSGVAESLGDALGAVRMRTKGDLERFKEFIEHRGTETGAWRGSVD